MIAWTKIKDHSMQVDNKDKHEGYVKLSIVQKYTARSSSQPQFDDLMDVDYLQLCQMQRGRNEQSKMPGTVTRSSLPNDDRRPLLWSSN